MQTFDFVLLVSIMDNWLAIIMAVRQLADMQSGGHSVSGQKGCQASLLISLIHELCAHFS